MRFVLLEHTPPKVDPESMARTMVPHFDLMLEIGTQEPLVTLAFEQLPAIGDGVAVELLAPHRREYLSYSGPVSGNRGEVRQVGAGRYAVTQTVAAWHSGEGSLELFFSDDSRQFAGQQWRLEIRDRRLVRYDNDQIDPPAR